MGKRQRIPKLPTGSRPIGPLLPKVDLSNVVFVCWTEPNRQVRHVPESVVIYVDFQNRTKIGHVVTKRPCWKGTIAKA